MMKLLLLTALVAYMQHQCNGGVILNLSTCKLDLVFCVDNTGSISFKYDDDGDYDGDDNGNPPENWKGMIKFTQELTRQINVSPDGSHIGLVDFDSTSRIQFDLNKHQTAAEAVEEVGKLQYFGGTTNIRSGLVNARKVLTDPQYGGRKGVAKVVVLITDGDPNIVEAEKERLFAEAQSCREAGVRVVVVGITKGAKKEVLERLPYRPDDYIHVDRFDQLNDVTNKILTAEACEALTTTTRAPTTTTKAPTTTTLAPTTPKELTTTTHAPTTTAAPEPTTTQLPPNCILDLVFCLDNTGSIAFMFDEDGQYDYTDQNKPPANWKGILHFTQELTKQIKVSTDGSHVGLVDFDNSARIRFDFNKYHTEGEALDYIGKIPFTGFQTNTTGGLFKSRMIHTDPKYGGRAGYPKVIVLITDGNPNVDEDNVYKEAQNCRDAGIKVIVLGITTAANKEIMERLAYDPSHYIHIDSFDELDKAKNKILSPGVCHPLLTTAQPTTSTKEPVTPDPGHRPECDRPHFIIL